MSATTSLQIHTRKRAAKSNILDLKLSEVFWLLGFNALLFESPIQSYTGFRYVDEIAALCLFGLAVAKVLANKERIAILDSRARTGVVLMLTVVCLGLLGNAVWGVQTQVIPILIDLFTCVKFPIALISACVVFSDSGAAFFKLVETEAKIVVFVLLILGVANLFVDFGMGTDSRYGLRAAFKAIFGHPTYLVFACVGLSIILLADWRKNLPWILMTLVVIALSLRSKGLVYAAFVPVILVLFAKKIKLSVFHVALFVVIAFLIGYGQYDYYFQTDGFARAELFQTSFVIASDYAPLGSGFATYGSAVTADLQYYSSLYYQYGLSTVHGLTPGNTSFLSDTFWPIVLGQFGWVGLVCYVGMLAALFSFVYRLKPKARLACICCFLYLLISSTSESAFFNPQAVYLALCLSLAIGSVDARREVAESIGAEKTRRYHCVKRLYG